VERRLSRSEVETREVSAGRVCGAAAGEDRAGGVAQARAYATQSRSYYTWCPGLTAPGSYSAMWCELRGPFAPLKKRQTCGSVGESCATPDARSHGTLHVVSLVRCRSTDVTPNTVAHYRDACPSPSRLHRGRHIPETNVIPGQLRRAVLTKRCLPEFVVLGRCRDRCRRVLWHVDHFQAD